MRTPITVSMVTATGVFLVVLLAVLFHSDSINGHVLSQREELPMALIGAVMASALALLGTWLGMRRNAVERLTYRAGLVVASLYIAVTYLANAATKLTSPQSLVIPSHDANIQFLKTLIVATLWGIGVPYAITRLLGRLKFFRASDNA